MSGQKGMTPQRKHLKQQQTHNVHTYDVENTNSPKKGGALLLVNKPWIRTEEQKGRCK